MIEELVRHVRINYTGLVFEHVKLYPHVSPTTVMVLQPPPNENESVRAEFLFGGMRATR